MNREIEAIYCSCGGKVEVINTTDQEEKKYGCHTKECCVNAFECSKCKVRWTFALCAPEVNYW